MTSISDIANPMRSSIGRAAGFTMIETMMAAAISLIAVTTFYAAAGQALRVVKTGKETAYASQLLQQRIEGFRAATLWTNVTTSSGITTLMTPATATAANFPGATEQCTVVAYPTAGTPLVVTRPPAGAVTATGAALSTQKCVQVTFQVSWTGVGKAARSRQIATILSKGGI